ncbi:class I SAM-dependent methyltransferase [Mycolicibacterium psychrotolerans]|uniref:class I SAM-dependent methyltransferase n=1 Tax=Mycolicibacterium psychrotolerans TaxID=216929 RepID=UPI003D6780FB
MGVADSGTVGRTNQTVDRTNIHRIWRAVLAAIALGVAVACYCAPVLLIVIGVLLVGLLCARLVYRDRGRFIPNLYARDIRLYDEAYQAFITQSLTELRGHRIPGHPLLWEASQLPEPTQENSDELLLDLGVWIGWSTRLTSDASGRTVYGFDTFEGLVEDWQIEDQFLIKQGTFSLSDPLSQRFIRETGVTLHDGIPGTLGRKVHYVKGRTYETLAPFLAERPGAPIRLFHMDLDTYESCLHGLETCKDRFVEGSILVFDEYLVTNGEMLAFFEFQARYGLEFQYRAWGLEVGEMNAAMVTSRFKRVMYYLAAIAIHLLDGRYLWKIFTKRFWRFWLGAPIGDIVFMLGAAGVRKSVSLEITGMGKLDPTRH